MSTSYLDRYITRKCDRTNLFWIVTRWACGANFSSMVLAKAVGVTWLAGASMSRRAKFWPSAYTTPFFHPSKSALRTTLLHTVTHRKNMMLHSSVRVEDLWNILCSTFLLVYLPWSCGVTLVFFLDLSWSYWNKPRTAPSAADWASPQPSTSTWLTSRSWSNRHPAERA